MAEPLVNQVTNSEVQLKPWVLSSVCSCLFSGATKGALDMLTRVMALELGPHKVTMETSHDHSYHIWLIRLDCKLYTE